jgi:hypothetical protein
MMAPAGLAAESQLPQQYCCQVKLASTACAVQPTANCTHLTQFSMSALNVFVSTCDAQSKAGIYDFARERWPHQPRSFQHA